MLRKLTVQNFYSVADAQTLDLRIPSNVPDPLGRFGTPIEGRKERFPRVVALFGANASGKTNVLRSIVFLVQILRDSVDWKPDQRWPFLAFEARQWKERPTKFKVEFDARILETHESRILYIYELEIAPGGLKVLSESLKYYPEGRPRLLFERKKNIVLAGKDFRLSKRDPVREKIRDNASLISTLARFNHKFSTAIYNNLSTVMTNVVMIGSRVELPVAVSTQHYLDNKEILQKLKKEIRRFDFGISDVELASTPNGVEPVFRHNGMELPMAYAFESHGTQRFYNIFPYLNFVLAYGGVAVLDEFDNDIHPLLLPELVEKFLSPDENPNNAQLIMSCHSPILFETLEKDEIFFTEKDNDGRTHVFGASEIKGVRRDTNLYEKYLSGALGGVPRVG